jgi:hypothetical protein
LFNRELKVDVVKKSKDEVNTPEVAFEVKAVFVSKLIDESVQKIMTGVFAYVILDTVRKVIVASVSKER